MLRMKVTLPEKKWMLGLLAFNYTDFYSMTPINQYVLI